MLPALLLLVTKDAFLFASGAYRFREYDATSSSY
jgi:hypothetical protein